MQFVRNFALPLAALLFALLIAPQSAMAGTANCPVEPKSDVAIASGDTFIGSNCTVHASGDVDSFEFSGNKGDTWRVTLGLSGFDQDLCLTVYPPAGAAIYYSCTAFASGYNSRVAP